MTEQKTPEEIAFDILKKLSDEHANGGEAFVTTGYGYFEDAMELISKAIKAEREDV